jgi:hypothetical protein
MTTGSHMSGIPHRPVGSGFRQHPDRVIDPATTNGSSAKPRLRDDRFVSVILVRFNI